MRWASVNGLKWLACALAYSYAIVLVLLVVWHCAFVNWPMPNGDVELYHKYAWALWNAKRHTATLPAEYPPLAALVFSLTLLPELPRFPLAAHHLGGTHAVNTVMSRDAGFAVWMGLFVLLTFAVCWRLTNQSRAWTGLAYLCISGVGVLLTRFDIVPALAVLLAFAAARKRWFALAFLLLAIGVALKLYPIFLVPVFVAFQWRSIRESHSHHPPSDSVVAHSASSSATSADRSASYRARARGRALAGVAVSAGIFAAFLVANIVIATPWAPKQGALAFLNYQSTRPLQVESFPATLMWLLGAFGLPSAPKFSFSSFNLVGPAEGVFITISYIGLALGCAMVYWRVLAGKLSFGRGVVAVIAIIILTGKVFSPQYLIWLVPLVAVVEGFDWVWLAICLLTAVDYPILYNAFAHTMMTRYDPLLLGVIAARNLLLLCVIVRLFYRDRVRQAATVVA